TAAKSAASIAASGRSEPARKSACTISRLGVRAGRRKGRPAHRAVGGTYLPDDEDAASEQRAVAARLQRPAPRPHEPAVAARGEALRRPAVRPGQRQPQARPPRPDAQDLVRAPEELEVVVRR